jgi:hypothetical protein
VSKPDTQSGGACPSEDDLSAYADGELSDAVGRATSDHLRACARCQERLAELVRTDSGLRALFEVAACELEEAGVPSGSASPGTRRHRLVLGIALAAAVLAAVTLLLTILIERMPSGPDRVAAQVPPQGAPEAGEGEVVFQPSTGPLRADTLSLALAGDVDAQIQLCRLNLAEVLVRTGGEAVSPTADVPTIEEMEASRQRCALLAQRVMGVEQ